MNANSSANTDSRWQKTPVANLVRHVQSGNYYARIRVCGKLIWKTLKTDRISVAKLRLGDFHKEERQRAAAQTVAAQGKMTFGDALATYQQKLQSVFQQMVIIRRLTNVCLFEAIASDATLFIPRDEVVTAWRIVDSIRACWDAKPLMNRKFYAAGTWWTDRRCRSAGATRPYLA